MKKQGLLVGLALVVFVMAAGATLMTQNRLADNATPRQNTSSGEQRYAMAEPDVGDADADVADAEGTPNLDVPYVPTPQAVVDKMLALANIQKNDVVYDLGCGDGRIVITAAKRYGVRGVGIDIDPQRIKESRENAQQQGVSDRVRFSQNDLFKTEIGEATVLMLYLLPEINLRLRPKIFRELKPGARIASHSFNMGEWTPDQTVQVKDDGYDRVVYFWVLPAHVGGTWQSEVGGQRTNLQINQKFQKIDGASNNAALANAKLTGDRISFTAGQSSYNGRVNGHTITGTVKTGNAERPWRATRNPDNLPPIEGDAADTREENEI